MTGNQYQGNRTYDVAVVGGGPAGSEAAYQLATKGFKTMLIEKRERGWDKPCGGGLPPYGVQDAFYELPKKVVEREIYGFRLHGPKESFADHITQYKGVIVKRHVYGTWLFERAIDAGAEYLEETQVRKVEEGKDRVTLSLGNGEELYAEFVIGADGMTSGVAKSLGIHSGWEKKDIALGAHYQIYMEESMVDEKLGSSIEMFFGSEISPQGYGWIFPARDMISVGIASVVSKMKGKSIRDYLEKFVSRVLPELNPNSSEYRKVFQSHLIPQKIPRRVGSERSLLVGDAAGLVSPATWEGINYARKSSIFAAELIEKCLENGNFDHLSAYEAMLKKHFYKSDFKYDYLFQRLFSNDRLLKVVIDGSNDDRELKRLFEILIGSTEPHRVAYHIMKKKLPRMLLKSLFA